MKPLPCLGFGLTSTKKTLLAEMRQRLQSPLSVCQGQQPFCGPAAVVYELIRKQPTRYVEICRSLFETGAFKAKTKRIEASAKLRQSSRGDLKMGQSDWLILATLRDAEKPYLSC